MSQEFAHERDRNIEKLARLRDYLRQGYLLHGSKSRLETIEPRQAHDEDPERDSGKANAVYAEAHDVRIPILMALFEKDDPELPGWRSSYHSTGPDSVISVDGENCRFGHGFVHVLLPDTFETEGDEHDREYISRSPVSPIDTIEVDASILFVLENVEISGAMAAHR